MTTETAHHPDRPMPLHNLLIHVTGYADRGCAACDWLRERGHIPPLATTDCVECGTPYTLCGHRPSPSAHPLRAPSEAPPVRPCAYTTSTADYCHTHQSHRAHSDGRCQVVTSPGQGADDE